ncbi:hypothetical protein VNI00_013077 [Paramarasmius palmivorus]|uniref:Uncharacterized protein n=1 Tax=Paramarasmius palmivorus TaxID=297713 RepID=A0AAW0BZV0_9AGAR
MSGVSMSSKNSASPASKAEEKSNQQLAPPKTGHRKSPSDPGSQRELEAFREQNKVQNRVPMVKEPDKSSQRSTPPGRKSPAPSAKSERITHAIPRGAQGSTSDSLKLPMTAEERRARTRSLESPATKQDLPVPKGNHRKTPSDSNIPKGVQRDARAKKDSKSSNKPPIIKVPAREDQKEPARTRKISLPTPKSDRRSPDPPSKPRSPNPISTSRTLKPPVTSEERQAKTRSLEVPPKREDKDHVLARPRPYTELHQEVKVPWGDTFRLGYGVDALTGDPTTRCALAPFRESSTRRRIKTTNTTINVLQWDDLKQLADGIELEAGVGTVNATSYQLPVELRAKLSSTLSASTSAKTVLVQYKTVGEFEVEFLPKDIALKKELRGMAALDFREQYGDYYIAGCQYGYSCRALVICRMNEQVDSNDFEAEAKAHVENALRIGVKSTDSKDHANKCTMLHVVIDTKGCSANMSTISDSNISSITATLRSLAQVTKNAPGTPQAAYLHHYSSLDHAVLSRRLEGVHYDLFKKAHQMRLYYAHLQAFLVHPALRTFDSDRTRISQALKAYENNRRKLVYLSNADKKKISASESVYNDLRALKDRSSLLNTRYEFIRRVKNMDTTIRSLPPTGSSRVFKWECGRTGGKPEGTSDGLRCVTFGPGERAYEAEWTSPMTKGRMLLFGGIGAKPYMEFGTVPLSSLSRKSLPPSKTRPPGMFAVPVPGQSKEETFAYQLMGPSVYVVGWSLSVDWDGKYIEYDPEIKVQGENNFILADCVSIRLDPSRAARWTCRVTFVFQPSFNFPDLNLQPGPTEEPVKKAHNLLLAGTSES